MEIKINVKVNTQNGVEDASYITERLQSQNHRRTRVEQLKEKPIEGQLTAPLWSNIITLVISSGFALGTITALFNLLKGRWVDIPIEKIKAETEKSKIEQQGNYVELDFQCGEKKYSFKLTKNDSTEIQKILETIKELEDNC